jgi:hypothetical protein
MRKFLSGIILIAMTTILVSCVGDIVDFDAVFDDLLGSVFVDGDTMDAVTEDLMFASESAFDTRVSVIWRTDRPDVILDDGTVIRPETEPVKVTVTLRLTFGVESRTRTFTVTVLPTITFDVRIVVGDDITNEEVSYGAATPLPTVETSEAFEFSYWTIEGSGEPYDPSTPVTQDIVLVAVIVDRTYDITFDSAGGTPVDAITDVIHSTTLRDLPVPSREGHVFVGWIFIDRWGNEQLLVEGRTIINHDIHAEARWIHR